MPKRTHLREAEGSDNEISEACGIFGVVANSPDRDIFPELYWGLLSLNHRGQQSYGFLTLSRKNFRIKEDLGLIPTEESAVKSLASTLVGSAGISNARYATSGRSSIRHLERGKQPLVIPSNGKKIAISYNGNIVNAKPLRKDLEGRFGRFYTDADTEVLGRELLLGLEEEDDDYAKAVGRVLDSVEGAYSVLVLDSEGNLHAFRDRRGIRPFCFARTKEMYAFASETPALEINGFEEYEYVRPGELVSLVRNGSTKLARKIVRNGNAAMCSFEYAYFARPDSVLDGREDLPVYKIRERFAYLLAKEKREKLAEDDLIVSMPETADDAAYGLHQATGLPWERAVRRNRYVTRRAFISMKSGRQSVIDKKMSIVGGLVRGKRLAVVEDSIVRGDTTKINIAKLRAKGAKKIDLYVTFPKISHPCFYGVDMSTYGEIIGSSKSEEEIARWLGADSVNYQSEEGLVNSIGVPRDELCIGCVTGRYPTPIAQKLADKIRSNYLSGISENGTRAYE